MIESLLASPAEERTMQENQAAGREKAQTPPSRLQIACWMALVVAMVWISSSAFGALQLGALGDDVQYYILAQSLIHSQHYGLIFAPGLPEPTRYPFGFPLLLAPIVGLTSGNLDAAKLLSLGVTLLNAGLIFWGWRTMSRRSHWWAVAVTSLYLFSPLVVGQSRMVMSEPAFTTFCLTALINATRIIRGRGSAQTTLFLSVSLFFALFVRWIGFVLVSVVLTFLVLKGGRRVLRQIARVVAGMALLLGLVLLLTPVAFSDLVPSQYLSQYGSLEGKTSTVAGPAAPSTNENAPPIAELLRYHIATDLAQGVLASGGGDRTATFGAVLNTPEFPLLFGLLVLTLVLFGFIRWMLESPPILPAFALVYLVTISIWDWQTPRLLYPVLPELFVGLLLGIEGVLIVLFRLPRIAPLTPYRSATMLLLVAMLLGVALHQSLDPDPSFMHVGDLAARSSWVKANTPSTAILLTEHPEVDYIYGGRKTVRPLKSYASAGDLDQFLTERRVSYLLIAPDIRWQDGPYSSTWSDQTVRLMSLVDQLAAAHQLELVYSSTVDKIQVYELTP